MEQTMRFGRVLDRLVVMKTTHFLGKNLNLGKMHICACGRKLKNACVRAAENPSQLTLCGKSSLPSSTSALASITQVLVIREKAKTRRPQCRAVVASCLGESFNIQVIKRFYPVN